METRGILCTVVPRVVRFKNQKNEENPKKTNDLYIWCIYNTGNFTQVCQIKTGCRPLNIPTTTTGQPDHSTTNYVLVHYVQQSKKNAN